VDALMRAAEERSWDRGKVFKSHTQNVARYLRSSFVSAARPSLKKGIQRSTLRGCSIETAHNCFGSP